MDFHWWSNLNTQNENGNKKKNNQVNRCWQIYLKSEWSIINRIIIISNKNISNLLFSFYNLYIVIDLCIKHQLVKFVRKPIICLHQSFHFVGYFCQGWMRNHRVSSPVASEDVSTPVIQMLDRVGGFDACFKIQDLILLGNVSWSHLTLKFKLRQ